VNINEPSPHLPDDVIDDVRLMQLADGELDAETEAALLAQLEGSLDAQRKLASLEVVGSYLRDAVDGDDRADGIAAAVMAALDAESSHTERERAPIERPLAEPHRPLRSQPRREAANDNSRSIFAIAGLAAAAAAALFLWSKTEPAEPTFASSPLPEAPLVSELATKLDASAAPFGAPAEVETVGEAEAGVEVASVEFGSHQGSVFYVPGDGTATAVVWINDAGDDP
jgi:negative regulator of sigma E activity